MPAVGQGRSAGTSAPPPRSPQPGSGTRRRPTGEGDQGRDRAADVTGQACLDLPIGERNGADRSAQVIIAGHAFLQNLRRGHYDLATDVPLATRLAAAFAELARAI